MHLQGYVRWVGLLVGGGGNIPSGCPWHGFGGVYSPSREGEMLMNKEVPLPIQTLPNYHPLLLTQTRHIKAVKGKHLPSLSKTKTLPRYYMRPLCPTVDRETLALTHTTSTCLPQSNSVPLQPGSHRPRRFIPDRSRSKR